MLHYIIKRLGQTLIVIFVVTILAFGLVRLAPGNPAELMLPETASEAEVKAMEEKLGLNKPLYEQYWMYISGMLKAFGVEVVPHNPLSTVSTAASLQIAASAPNFAILEYPLGQQEPPQSVVLQPAPKVENGFMHFSDKPGIGVELVEGAAELYPYKAPFPRETHLHCDGSIFDL